MTEIQDKAPAVKEEIDKVGISGFRTYVKVSRGGAEISHYPTIDLCIDLPRDRKGAHMSRLAETITEVISLKAKRVEKSLEDLGKEILTELSKRHPYRRAEISISSLLMLRKKSPASRSESLEPYDIKVTVANNGGVFRKTLEVVVMGGTCCPHSLELLRDKAHIQRSKLIVNFKTDLDTSLSLEDLIEACESALSSPTYGVLKSEDEERIIKDMYNNPRFIEDCVRDCFDRVRKLGHKGLVRIRGVSEESIHKHNIVAEITREIK